MRKIVAVLFVSIILISSAAFGAEDDILGIWSISGNTTGNDTRVEIYKCGDKFCGKIVELKYPYFADDDSGGMGGKPKVDRLNPDPELKSRPLLGLGMLNGFSYSGGDVWKGGTIYDPDDGKTYKCKMTLTDQNRLEVRGYIGISLFGRTMIWAR